MGCLLFIIGLGLLSSTAWIEPDLAGAVLIILAFMWPSECSKEHK